MIDITLCGTANCPLAVTCYRKLAQTNNYQSYAFFIPHIVNGITTCSHYVEVER